VTVNCAKGAMLQRAKGIQELLTVADGANMLPQNVDNQLPTYAAQHHRGTKTMPLLLTDIP